MKRFDNIKDCYEYLKDHAKKGETVILDEAPTIIHPRRIKKFTKIRE